VIAVSNLKELKFLSWVLLAGKNKSPEELIADLKEGKAQTKGLATEAIGDL